MKKYEHRYGPSPSAFTLIEMLVVIAIMATLAAMIFPVAGAIKKKATKTRVQAELAQVEAAIERYKTKFGFYPPDNWPKTTLNQLYFELLGTVFDGQKYRMLDGALGPKASDLGGIFGPKVAGFVNSTKAGAGDEGPVAVKFLTGLKPTQVADLSQEARLLVCSVRWPEDHPYQPLPGLDGINPWRYDSSSTNRHNLGSYDLWVDILIGGKTNRISNWNKQPEIVGSP